MTAFLFDNDGVLVDSTEFHWLSWECLMKEHPEFSMSRKDFVHCFGKRNDLILREVMPQLSEREREALALRKEEIFREIAKNKIELLPGMENFLKIVKKEEFARIIASSAPLENLEMFITQTPLKKYFDKYLSAEGVAHGKPAPDIFLAAAAELGFSPKECIVIEDAPAGVVAGRAAGCFVIALGTTHKKQELTQAHLYFPSAEELDLEKILKAFNQWKGPSLMDKIHESPTFQSLKKSRWRYVVGGFLVILGSILFFLPVGPGLFLILLGLYVINSDWTNKKIRAVRGYFKKWKKKKK